MKFTITELKLKGPLCHDHFKKVYDWDYFTYTHESIWAYRNGNCVRQFNPEEFATLVVLTNCENDWRRFVEKTDKNEFSLEEIVSIIDNLYRFKSTCKQISLLEQVILYSESILDRHGYEYYRPEVNVLNPTYFNSDLYDAVGVCDKPEFPTNTIVLCTSGGVKNISTNKIVKYPKVYVAK